MNSASLEGLEKSDEIMEKFIKSKPENQRHLIISFLLSRSLPRQIFGSAIVRTNFSVKHRADFLVQSVLSQTLSEFDLSLDETEKLVEKLFSYLQYTAQIPDDPISSLLGEEGSSNAGLLQAIAVAIEVSALYLLSGDSVEAEEKLWRSWLKCFVAQPLLCKFPKQLISRVHLTRHPSNAYIRAIESLETDDSNLLEAIQSCRLLASPPPSLDDMPGGVKLDHVSCRRFMQIAKSALKAEGLTPPFLDAVLSVAGNPRYDAFLHRVLDGMRSSGKCWLETVLIGQEILARREGKNGTMQEVLSNLESFLDAS